jgi:hypothetical protein
MEERKFLSDWKLAVMFSALVWLFTYLEAVVTKNLIGDLTLWTHNYIIFAAILTFLLAFLYMRKQGDFVWYEEGVAFAVVLILINLFLDYGVIFFLLGSLIFTIENAVLYISQFLLCVLASFVVKRKYISKFRI